MPLARTHSHKVPADLKVARAFEEVLEPIWKSRGFSSLGSLAERHGSWERWFHRYGGGLHRYVGVMVTPAETSIYAGFYAGASASDDPSASIYQERMAVQIEGDLSTPLSTQAQDLLRGFAEEVAEIAAALRASDLKSHHQSIRKPRRVTLE